VAFFGLGCLVVLLFNCLLSYYFPSASPSAFRTHCPNGVHANNNVSGRVHDPGGGVTRDVETRAPQVGWLLQMLFITYMWIWNEPAVIPFAFAFACLRALWC
jgi:hypothetical protein